MREDERGWGTLSQRVKQLLAFTVLRQGGAAVFNPSLNVTVTGETAEVSGLFIFARERAKSADFG
jgi:hypothetical protein